MAARALAAVSPARGAMCYREIAKSSRAHQPWCCGAAPDSFCHRKGRWGCGGLSEEVVAGRLASQPHDVPLSLRSIAASQTGCR